MTKYELGELVPSELGNQLGRSERPVQFVANSDKVPQAARGLRVLLFYPNMRGHTMLPPAIALFSALLKERGCHVDLFDTTYYAVKGFSDNFDSDKEREKRGNVLAFDFGEIGAIKQTDGYEDFIKKVEEFQPDLLAVSCTEDMYLLGISFLRYLRRHHNILTVMGGVFATFAPHIAISAEEVDIVCVGEGEYALVELCERLQRGEDYSNVSNLWVKDAKKGITRNPISVPVNMEDNPLLDISIFESNRLYRPMQGKVYRMLPVETHRGCPYTCAFCNSPSQNRLYAASTNENFFRKKQFDYVRKELTYYRDVVKAEFLYFWADTFFAYSPREFDEFVELYSEFKTPFWCQTRPETITQYKIRRLKEVGLFKLGVGIEHGNQKFRKETVDRAVPDETIVNALKWPKEEGVLFGVNNIVGFPGETKELAMDTVRINRQVAADTVNCYSFTPFHGIPLRKIAEDKGYITPGEITRSLTRGAILDMPEFSRDEIRGVVRTFVMKVKFPESRWPEIEIAEQFSDEGDRKFNELSEELQDMLLTQSGGIPQAEDPH